MPTTTREDDTPHTAERTPTVERCLFPIDSPPVNQDLKRRRLELPERGIEVNVLDWGGEGPLALLIHANGFCAGVWDPVARGLSERYHVVGFDARGHGESSKPREPADYVWEVFVADLIAVTERITRELAVARVELAVGHSFGGTATLGAAARRPDLFARIALLDPVLVAPPEIAAKYQRPNHGKRMGKIARKRRHVWPSREAVRKAWTKREPFQSWDPRALDAYLSEGLGDRADGQVELKCPGEIEAMIYDSDERLDAFAAAEKLEAPALLVWAAQGNFPLPWYRALRDTASRMELVEMDAGHLLPMVAPDPVTQLLLRFGAQS